MPPFVTSIMTNFIKLDVTEHLKNKYPNLDSESIDLIAQDVSGRWDYRSLIDDVDIKCKQTAYYANIELGEDSNNEREFFKYEPMEHSSEGC